jgi:hypothetical protein
VGLLPDFVGYFLVMQGLGALEDKSRHFARALPWVKIMLVCSAILYGLELLDSDFRMAFALWLLGLGATVVRLVIGTWLVSGLRDQEKLQRRDLQGDKLSTMWMIFMAISAIAYLTGWIPLIGDLVRIAGLIMGICYLAAFYQTRKLYLTPAERK